MNCTSLITRFARISRMPLVQYRTSNSYSTKPNESEEIPTNPWKDANSAAYTQPNGKVYDKKPIKVSLTEGKTYRWCACGYSSNQPFCNGSHFKFWLGIKQRPVKFTVTKTKEYSLCVCKQTKNRPFCDGSHRKL